VIRVYDEAGNVIKTHEQAGDFREPSRVKNKKPPRGETVTADCETSSLRFRIIYCRPVDFVVG
jgi:hypothetical protein